MSDTALATREQVVARLEDEPTPKMLTMIDEYLEDASDQARFYGKEWTQDSCPPAIMRMVANAVARFMRNPDGFEVNRAGDETLGWQELPKDAVGNVYFSSREIERIQRLANPVLPKFGTMQMIAYGDRPEPEPLSYPVLNGSPFPVWHSSQA